jgi:hypothetical protein
MLLRTPLNERASCIVGPMQSSVARMSGLIDNVLDFARGRLGGGFTFDRNANKPLEPVLNQVIAELHASDPDRTIEVDFALFEPVNCDPARIAQLLSNLLGNALSYVYGSAFTDRSRILDGVCEEFGHDESERRPKVIRYSGPRFGNLQHPEKVKLLASSYPVYIGQNENRRTRVG